MNWTKEVYQHTTKFEQQYIEQGIQESIDITFYKIFHCLYDEVTKPITKVNYHNKQYTLFIHQDVYIEYNESNRSVRIFENANSKIITDPLSLLKWLSTYSSQDYNYERLITEIENHLINQAISIITCSQMPKSDHPLLRSEQYVITGHNLHPCAKTKLGLTYNEVMQFSPEYNQAFKLNWILVKQGLLYSNLNESDYKKIVDFSEYAKHIPEGYDIVPVHPYQFNHVIPEIYREEIAAKQIILCPHVAGLVKSTSSFRTVCPLDDDTPLIKLPVNSQMTSTIRSISNNSIINSKNISKYFKHIYETDDALNEISIPVLEFGGMTYIHDNEDKQRNLSFILRENNTKHIRKNAILFTATCLFEKNEHDKKVYVDLIHSASINTSPIDWFKAYINILIQTTLTLMTKYGIGLEAHLQNISFEFINNIPVRVHVRDFGGLRIDANRIPNWVHLKEALTNASTEGMYEKVQNTLVSNHLSTLITHFSRDFDIESSHLWHEVEQVIQSVFKNLKTENIRYTDDDMAIFYTEKIKEKALLTMRVAEKKKDIYVLRENPLLTYEKLKL